MPAAFALALLSVDGLGPTTAHRLLERFPTHRALRETPREQILLRIKGAPRASALVDQILGPAFEAEAIPAAQAQVEALEQRGIRVVAPGSDVWPAALDDLPRAERPVVLRAYGSLDALARPALACLGRPPLAPEVFERAQAVARQALGDGVGLALGMQSGFDVALQKLSLGAGRGAVAVLGCGLARLEPSLRPAATALTRGGGLLVSPFPMTHGPFDHDDTQRGLVQAALGRAVLVTGAEATAEKRAVEWAETAGRPIVDLSRQDTDADPWKRLWPGASNGA